MKLTLDSPILDDRSPPGETASGLAVEGSAGGARGPRAHGRANRRRPPPSLPAALHRPLAGGDDPGSEGGGVRHGHRVGAQGRETTDATSPDDGHRHAVRQDRPPRSDVLQPAVARVPLQGGTGAGRLRRRDALPRAHPAREPGGRAPPRRRRRPDPHRAHHPRAPRVGGHHDEDDPRAGVCGARAAPEDPRPAPGRAGRGRSALRLRPGAAEDPLPRASRPARSSPGTAEVRRAVHAGARRRVPQAPGRGRADRRGAHGGGSADGAARPDAAVRADRGTGASHPSRRRGHGAAAADERAPAGRRRCRQDPGRAPGGARRDPVRPPGRDHGPDRGAGRAAPAVRRLAARGRRRRLVPRSGARGGQGRRAGLAARSLAREPAGRIRDVRAC